MRIPAVKCVCVYRNNLSWNKHYRVEDLGVRFYSGDVGRPGFPIEWYLSCDQMVWGKNISKSETTLCLASTVFYSIRRFFPDHWDSGFHSIVDHLFEVVPGMRPGFHFIGVRGGVTVGNDIANIAKY